MTGIKRVTANLPRDLLDDALRASGRGITETLIEGLDLVRRRRAYESVMELRGKLHLSSIFKWYAGDFTGGSTVVAFFARGGVLDWVTQHLADRRLAAELRERRPSVKYLDYDWSLNDR